MNLPATFSRDQVLAVFDALGLTGREEISVIEITGTQIEVGYFVFDDDGHPIKSNGEFAQVFVTIPVDDDEDLP